MKLLLIFNPVAGDGNHDELLQDLKIRVKEQDLHCDIFTTSGNNDAKEIDEKLRSSDYTHVIAAGGDGTISEVAKYSRKYDMPLGILPLGTSNGLARDLCIPKDPLQAFQLIIDSDHLIHLDTLIANDNYPFIHLGDVGANANLLARNEATASGKLRSAINAFQELHSNEYFSYRIRTEEEELEGSANMISFCNAKRYGTGIPLTKKGQPNDGLFELVVFKDIKISTLLNSALAAIDSGFLDQIDTRVIISNAATVTLNAPQLMQLDGELIGERKQIELKIGEDKTTIVCNQNCPYLP